MNIGLKNQVFQKLFVVVKWPEVKSLLNCQDFESNALPINDDNLCDEFGSSAYLVRKSWLEDVFKNNDVDLNIEELNNLEKEHKLKILKVVDERKFENGVRIFLKEDYADFDKNPFQPTRVIHESSLEKCISRVKSAKRIYDIDDIGEMYIKKGKSSFVRVKYNEILYVEAMMNYIALHTFNKKHIMHTTLKSAEGYLTAKHFKRAHRSFLVNIKNVDKIEDNSIQIKTSNGFKHIPIGKNYKKQLLSEISFIKR